ncbi:MAG: hypothetical protein ACE5G1_06375, partial [bacterium]
SPQKSFESVVFTKDHPLLENGYNSEFVGLGHLVVKEILKKVLSDNQDGLGLATYKVLHEAEEPGLLINFRYRIESEGLKYNPATGEAENGMEVLVEEIIPVFVSNENCSYEKGHQFVGCESIKAPFPDELVPELHTKLNLLVKKAEQLVKQKISEKKQKIESERKKRIAMRCEDLDRYYQGMLELHSQRLKKYEREKEIGLERTALINREKFEIETLEKRVNQQRNLLKVMGNVYDYAPEILNAAWIIPESLTRRTQNATH